MGKPNQFWGDYSMRRLAIAAVVVACAGLVGSVRADDKASVNGSWKWSAGRGNNVRDLTLKLKLDGDKLTGTVAIGQDELKIEEGTYKDGEVSFKLTIERNGTKRTTKYVGKLSGDSIKGKAEAERNGQKTSRDWEAKRVKD